MNAKGILRDFILVFNPRGEVSLVKTFRVYLLITMVVGVLVVISEYIKYFWNSLTQVLHGFIRFYPNI